MHQLDTSKQGLFSNSHPLLPYTSGCFYLFFFLLGLNNDNGIAYVLCVCLSSCFGVRTCVSALEQIDRQVGCFMAETHREKDTLLISSCSQETVTQARGRLLGC